MSSIFKSARLPLIICDLLGNYDDNFKVRAEPDFYGASRQIARLLRLDKIPMSYASWSHGCQNSVLFKEQVAWDNNWQFNRLVRNEEVKLTMESFGFRNIHAVGMPINYVESQGRKRQINSVLFMPAHSLSYVKIKQDILSLATEALELRRQDCYVCFCVHRDCVANGEITQILDQHNIDWFAGSSASDMNSLQRMRNIFEHFEYIASNTMGSHFYYSQLFGAKFFFTGSYFEYSPPMFAKDPFWTKYPEICSTVIKAGSKAAIQARFPKYFDGFQNAICDQTLAEFVCGKKHVRPATEVAKLLGWSRKSQLLCPFPYYASKALNKFKTKITRI